MPVNELFVEGAEHPTKGSTRPVSPHRPERTEIDAKVLEVTGNKAVQHPQEIEMLVTTMATQINAKRKCVTFNSLTDITLAPDTSVAEYRSVIYFLAQKLSQAEGMANLIKFWVGDILVQGEEILGEDAACVLGKELSGDSWSKRTVDNITWVCRNLPKEHRRLSLNWNIHRSLAPKWIAPEDQAHYIEKAMELAKSPDPEKRDHYCRDTMRSIHEKYMIKHLDAVIDTPEHKELWKKDPEKLPRTHWEDFIAARPNMSYPFLKEVMAKRTPYPPIKNDITTWIREYTLANSPSDEATRFCMDMGDNIRSAVKAKQITLYPERADR